MNMKHSMVMPQTVVGRRAESDVASPMVTTTRTYARRAGPPLRRCPLLVHLPMPSSHYLTPSNIFPCHLPIFSNMSLVLNLFLCKWSVADCRERAASVLTGPVARRPLGSCSYLSLQWRARLGQVRARRVRLGAGSAWCL